MASALEIEACFTRLNLESVVQKVVSAMHWINLYCSE